MASERWSPVQSVEKILLSVLSMLSEPNCESPANIDAAKLYRENRPAYNREAEKASLLSTQIVTEAARRGPVHKKR